MLLLLAVTLEDIRVAMLTAVLAALFQAIGEGFIVIRELGWSWVMEGARLRKDDISEILKFAGPMFLVSLLAASGAWLLGRMILGGGKVDNMLLPCTRLDFNGSLSRCSYPACFRVS